MDATGNLGVTAEEARNSDSAGPITIFNLAKAIKPPKFPTELIRMIFVEFLSKPAIHFVEITFHERTKSTYSKGLRPYSGNNVQSGYIAAQIMSKTCHLACDVLHQSTLQKSHIRMDSGPVPVDAATDLVCLVLPDQPTRPPHQPSPYNPYYDRDNIAERLGNPRRAGVLVTKQMWNAVLANWFTPLLGTDGFEYGERDGRLSILSLFNLMASIPDLEAFYFILADATADDWSQYYHRFPITFHDHTGSYAEAYERPIHHIIMSALWGSNEDDFDFPYNGIRCRGWVVDRFAQPNVDLNPTLPLRVDTQMENKTRVALLLGLLEACRRETRSYVDLSRIKLGVLVRKPDSVTDNAAFTTPRDPKPISQQRRFFGLEDEGPLGSKDSEAKWVKLALDRIEEDSATTYLLGKPLEDFDVEEE